MSNTEHTTKRAIASANWSNRHYKLRSSVHSEGYDTKVFEKIIYNYPLQDRLNYKSVNCNNFLGTISKHFLKLPLIIHLIQFIFNNFCKFICLFLQILYVFSFNHNSYQIFCTRRPYKHSTIISKLFFKF